jgi:diaminohydroxyphosphoribosylaminopyrimidine deaminase/5-amino-6-(5-phosphoribosylamino)uracil reductase
MLAELGKGNTSPNPMVGAVLVFENRVIGEGYHKQYGEAHAEVNCLQSVLQQDQDLIPLSTLYVSLEPCSHFGKTPPCVDLILKQKIQHVVIACRDRSEKVNGKGIQKLKEGGIQVTEGILENEAITLNQRFFTAQIKSRPYIILKWAESADKYIATSSGKTKISNQFSDKLVHKWRSEEDAIWVGYNTATVDNPTLDSRHWNGKNPLRIVYDRDLSLTPTLALLNGEQKTYIFNNNESKIENNNTFIQVSKENFLQHILNYLNENNITSILVEGGAQLHQLLLTSNLWDEIRIIQSSAFLYEGIHSACLPSTIQLTKIEQIETDAIYYYKNTLI